MSVSKVLGMDPSVFLAEYWQKKPLLVRQAFAGGLDCVDGDTLAGLACEEGIESRLVVEHGLQPWATRFGPFEDEDFAALPASHWTLLVQAVDRCLPDVAALKQEFLFLPNWRLDDVMISYAADRGSVGPHVDNYDVFLIQGQGRRRWDIGGEALVDPELLPGLDLKILKEFKSAQSFVLEPGDMLYLPPGFAHHGVALDPCITYSIGFRAPTDKEMVQSFGQYLAQHMREDGFYQDPDLSLRAEPGLILPVEMQRLRNLMLRAFEDPTHFQRWLGGFLTEPRSFHSPAEDSLEVGAVLATLEQHSQLIKGEGVRMAYYKAGDQLFFAVEGETLVLSSELEALAAYLCREQLWESSVLRLAKAAPGFAELMSHLWNQGYTREWTED